MIDFVPAGSFVCTSMSECFVSVVTYFQSDVRVHAADQCVALVQYRLQCHTLLLTPPAISHVTLSLHHITSYITWSIFKLCIRLHYQ